MWPDPSLPCTAQSVTAQEVVTLSLEHAWIDCLLSRCAVATSIFKCKATGGVSLAHLWHCSLTLMRCIGQVGWTAQAPCRCPEALGPLCAKAPRPPCSSSATDTVTNVHRLPARRQCCAVGAVRQRRDPLAALRAPVCNDQTLGPIRQLIQHSVFFRWCQRCKVQICCGACR